MSTYAVDTITVGRRPMGIDISPDGEWVLVVNNDDDTVSVIRTGDATQVVTIPVGVEPLGIAIDHAGRYAYVTNSTDTPLTTQGTVSVIDLSTFAVVDTLTDGIGKFPTEGIAISNDDSKLAVANFNDDSVSIIDTSTRQVTQEIVREDGFAPMDVKFGPGDTRLYIAYYSDGTNDHVSSIDLAGSGPDIYYDQSGDGPVSVDFHPGGVWFVASNYVGNGVYHYNLQSGATGTVNVAAGPFRSAFTADGSRLLVPCFRSSGDIHPGVVEVFDTSGGTPTRITRVSVGVNPLAVAIANQALSHPVSRRDASQVNLFASPKLIKSSEGVYLKYAVVLPDGISGVDVGVIVGGVLSNVYYYAFTSGFRDMVPVNPNRISSIPKAISRMRLTNGMNGYLRVSGLPGGSNCQLFVGLTDAKSGKLIYSNFSNTIAVE